MSNTISINGVEFGVYPTNPSGGKMSPDYMVMPAIVHKDRFAGMDNAKSDREVMRPGDWSEEAGPAVAIASGTEDGDYLSPEGVDTAKRVAAYLEMLLNDVEEIQNNGFARRVHEDGTPAEEGEELMVTHVSVPSGTFSEPGHASKVIPPVQIILSLLIGLRDNPEILENIDPQRSYVNYSSQVEKVKGWVDNVILGAAPSLENHPEELDALRKNVYALVVHMQDEERLKPPYTEVDLADLIEHKPGKERHSQ